MKDKGLAARIFTHAKEGIMKRIYEEKILKNPKETLFENVEAALKKINNSQTALYGSLEAVDALEGRKCNFQVRKYKLFGTV